MNKEKFNSLPKNKQARVIAYDVISQVFSGGNVEATPGKYIHHDSMFNSEDVYFNDIKNSTCEVCAKGAALYSYFSLTESNISLSRYRYSLAKDLRSIFGDDIHIMEYVFERRRHYYGVRDLASLHYDERFSEEVVQNFYDFCGKLPGNIYQNAIEQIMRNYLLNDTIDLSNHPAPQEEIYSDEVSGTVTICDVYPVINLNEP